MNIKEFKQLHREAEEYYPDTGWRCSVCFELAQVMVAGETMCVKHAKEWSHGYGKSIKKMKEELE